MKVGSKVKVIEAISGVYPVFGPLSEKLTPSRELGEIVTVSAFLNGDGTIGDENAGGITLVEDEGAVHPMSGRPLGHRIEQFEEVETENC